MPKIDAICFTPFLVGSGVPFVCLGVCSGLPLADPAALVWVGLVLRWCALSPASGGWGVFETSTESLILAQDERWRRA